MASLKHCKAETISRPTGVKQGADQFMPHVSREGRRRPVIAPATLFRALCAALALVGSSVLGAGAEEKPAIHVELNNAQAQGDGCRVSFLFRNGLASRLDEFALEVVLFDSAGKVSEFLVFNAGSLPEGKSRVRQFDLKGHACDAISRLLVNDVKSCKAQGLTAEACLGLTTVTSTAGIRLEM